MAKRVIQDIFVKKNSGAAEPRRPLERIELPPRPSSRSFSSLGTKPLWKRKRFWTLLVGLPIILFFFVSTSFGSAEVALTLRQETVTLDSVPLTLVKRPDTTHVHYETMTIEDEASIAIPATQSQNVERKARGAIVIYNNFDTKTQKLVAGTRFQAPNGKIYKIEAPVTIPGATKKGSSLVPGSVEAEVVAAEAGDSYNLGLSDFTIPGFAGTPRFEGFYARSKTEMTGGFKGTALVPKDTDVLDGRHKLEGILREQLLAKAQSELPEGYLFFTGADFYDFTFFPPVTAEEESQLSVKAKGELTALIIERSSLASVLAAYGSADYAGEAVDLLDPELIDIALRGKENIDPATSGDLKADFTGEAHVVWTIDETDLKSDLAGLPKAAAEEVFQKYPAIITSGVVFKPPWLTSFPEQPSQIYLTTDSSK